MARALIVGCGCRGRELGAELLARGWPVRGTTRTRPGLAAIERAGIEGALADPDRAGTVLDLVEDVAVVVWAMGSARGEPRQVAAVNGSRLERVLERLVDTPVRGFVYEGAGSAPARVRERGAIAVRQAAERWRIPVAVVDTPPADPAAWTRAMAAAATEVIGLG